MKLKLLSSIIFILCIFIFLSLGFWQLDRAKEKDNIVNLYSQRQVFPIEKLDYLLSNSVEKKYYRNYKIQGKFINKTFLIDNKIKNKSPGFNVISLFKITKSGEIITVDRGWIPLKGKREHIVENYKYLNDQKIADKEQELSGYIYPIEKSYTIGKISVNKSWPRLLQAISFDEIKASIIEKNLFISGLVFRLDRSSNFGFDREWKIIFMDSKKHLGYAFQWFSMAVALIVLVILFLMRKKSEQK